MQIHPLRLYELRKARKLSQQALADRARVTKKTIGRIEAKRKLGEPGTANRNTVDLLARALQVDAEYLAGGPDAHSESSLQSAGFQRLSAVVDADVALAYRMVEFRYGVSGQSLIEMAPLFFTLLAEGSLGWRRQMLSGLEEATAQLEGVAGRASHLSFAYPSPSFEDGIAQEEHSIRSKDLFGDKVGTGSFADSFDRSRHNPFADYLRHLAQAIDDSEAVEIDRYGTGELWNMNDRAPSYRIGGAVLDNLTGKDVWAVWALAAGHVTLADIPEELLGEAARQRRIEWLTRHVPPEERKPAEFDLSGLQDEWGVVDD